jgi:cytochrome oxidase Cu insertion factor (SCO1/SenC/PrrC family)
MSAAAAPERCGTPRRRSLWPLWTIAAISAAPLVFSWCAYQLWRPTATANYGALVETRPLPDAPLRLADGAAFRLGQLKGKWVLLMVDAGDCDQYCGRKLYMLRQLRLAQGKDMMRIERVWLMSDAAAPPAGALNGYEGTWLVRAAGSGVLEQLPVETALTDHTYVVDPLGNLVLRYARDADPARIIKDISRLLKTSRVE